MKKITSKQVFTYVFLLGIIAIVAVYFLVYKKNMDLAAQKNASNDTLQVCVDALKQYYDAEPEYLAKMEPMQKEIDEILAPYPSKTMEEDLIMQAVNTQMITPITYSSIALGQNTVMRAIGADVVTNAGIEKYQEQINFVERKATYTNQIDYPGLKDAIRAIQESDYMIGINSISYVTMGTEGKLSGSLDLSFYSVSGTGKEYVKPNILPYVSGTDCIFGFELEEEEE